MAEPLVGRDAVVAATGAHPYARLTTGEDTDITGVRDGSTVVWITRAGTTVCALGDGAVAAAAARRVTDARWWHLPRLSRAPLPVAPRVRDEWDFRWTSSPPPTRPGEDRATPVDDDAGISALLEVAFPSTTTRPGDARVRAWWAIRDGSDVVACAADRSRGGVGFLSAIAVHPRARGLGLGAALTAALTRQLLAEFGIAALGVMSDNTVANGMYAALGYTASIPRTTIGLP
ncbi:GNAT family N-acetyltransferase [Asanoa sp. WMMD1127]|uniref:GNAT family N-acetyltransferase n=1 Tax=Asanoa sp. WMMD1127 TaxID=3016107 RepID=UPI0024162CE4|nr:GNAT family N-acetyltransferase [Asanoa sp. WMMD1127]MDG4824434.1 GNAT family N-acetyltransferase [Asanoa sp. WMMD1127]